MYISEKDRFATKNHDTGSLGEAQNDDNLIKTKTKVDLHRTAWYRYETREFGKTLQINFSEHFLSGSRFDQKT